MTRMGRGYITGVLLLVGLIATPQAPAADNSAALFHKLHDQWTQTTQQLNELRKALSASSPDSRQQLIDQYKELLAQRQALAPQLAQTAEDAYRTAPNQDPDVAQYMVALVAGLLESDEYEQASQLVRLLIDNRHPDPKVFDLAGYTAFATSDFVRAQGYFRAAKEAGALGLMSKQVAPFAAKEQAYWDAEQKIRQAESDANDLPRVKFETSKGAITFELFENEAPNTVANFISLVESGFYDGLVFHRVLPNFMAQGGDPKGNGTGGPGWAIACECYRKDFRRHFRGSLSMAHAGRDTGGSQFFITFLPTPHLDGKHTVFGRVIDGMDVLAWLRRRQPDEPVEADQIVKATVLRKRDHDYKPTKLSDRRK